MLITEVLARNAQFYGDEICLVEVNPALEQKREVTWREYELMETNAIEHSRREMTWRQFDDAANRFANLLLSRGLGKGSKVAILLMNCLEWLPIYFGILKTGAVAIPMNYRYTSEEIEYCLKLAEADALVFGPEFIGRIEAIVDRIPQVDPRLFVTADCPTFAESYRELASAFSAEAPQMELSEEDDAAIYFSSGTTGFPKAILHDHRSIMSSAVVEQAHHGQNREDNFMCIAPLYHTGGKMHYFGSLLSGSRGVLLRGTKPEWILKAISDEHVTVVWLLVPWAQDILEAIERGDVKLENYELAQWRLMHIGAQPVPPSLVHRWKQHFPDHDYDTDYGLTESVGPGCVHLGLENIHKVGAIGKPGYQWETVIVTESGDPVAQGDVGELAVKGPGVMKGYYNDPEATAAVLKGGWLLTGDMARMDEDGFIYLVDRKKDVIITGGENIYPVQVEDFLHKHDAIKDVAVIGLPDERLGEIAAAIIQLKRGHHSTEAEILDFCGALPRYKRPRKIIFDEVPRNATGKIDKPALRKKYHVEGLVETETTH
ncbi:MAG: AMP-dependent synthetase [Actinobacteria bacterium RBG_16_64_13]|nr:MAG: AMP-dependent synthetase [Actinobacteria bacterium RBG_16_64_13]